MSGFAVVFGPELPAEHLTRLGHRMARHLRHRGGDREDVRSVGPCVLVHAAHWTTPEAKDERQPLRHAARDLWLTADLRVDNAGELRGALGSAARHDLMTDADIALAAHAQWDSAWLQRVSGDFAGAVWDGEGGELHLFRDAFGIRPLFYSTEHPGCVVAASSLAAVLDVLEALGTVRRPDEDFVSSYLVGQPLLERSWWAGVRRLPPGHRLTASHRGLEITRWWRPSTDPLEMSQHDASARLVELFDDAVRARMRTVDAVASDLSGGLDSSTVAATAAMTDPSVVALTIGYRRFPECDETAFAAAVASHAGLRAVVVDHDEFAPVDPAAHFATHLEPLYAADATDTCGVFAAAKETGASVSLNGVGGDELLHGSALATLEGHQLPTALWRLAGLVARNGFRSMATEGSRHPLSAAAVRRARELRLHRAKPWLGPEVVGRVVATTPTTDIRRPAAERLALLSTDRWTHTAYSFVEHLGAVGGVEARFPFLDRRLAEFVLRLPEDLIRPAGEYRGLHRMAFGARLPDVVATRTDKAEFSAPFIDTLRLSYDGNAATEALRSLRGRVSIGHYEAAYRGLAASTSTPGCPGVSETWAALTAGASLHHEFSIHTLP